MNKYFLSLTFYGLFVGVLFDIVSFWRDNLHFFLSCQDLCMVNKLFTNKVMRYNNRDSHYLLLHLVFGNLLFSGYFFHFYHIRSVSKLMLKDS